MSSTNETESRRRNAEIRRLLDLIRTELGVVVCHIARIEVLRIENWQSSSPSAEFELQCRAQIAEYREQERDLKERFDIQAGMFTD